MPNTYGRKYTQINRLRCGCSQEGEFCALRCLAEGKRAEQKKKRRAAYHGGELPTRANMGYSQIKQGYR